MFIKYTANTIAKSIAIKLNVCVFFSSLFFFVDLPHRLLVAVFFFCFGEVANRDVQSKYILHEKKDQKFNLNQREITAKSKG